MRCTGLEDHAMENDFDLLMENASHSDESWGYEFAQPVGDGCSVGTQLLWPRTEVRKRVSVPGQVLSGLRPTGGRYSKNEVAGFLAGKIVQLAAFPLA